MLQSLGKLVVPLALGKVIVKTYEDVAQAALCLRTSDSSKAAVPDNRAPQGLRGEAPSCTAQDAGSVPASGRSPGEGHGHPLQASCLENSMDRGDWRATDHRIAKSQTRRRRLSTRVQLTMWAQRHSQRAVRTNHQEARASRSVRAWSAHGGQRCR